MERVAEEVVEEQLDLPGLGWQEGVQMMGERGQKVEVEMKVDWTGTEGQEGSEAELLVPGLGFGGVGGQ